MHQYCEVFALLYSLPLIIDFVKGRTVLDPVQYPVGGRSVDFLVSSFKAFIPINLNYKKPWLNLVLICACFLIGVELMKNYGLDHNLKKSADLRLILFSNLDFYTIVRTERMVYNYTCTGNKYEHILQAIHIYGMVLFMLIVCIYILCGRNFSPEIFIYSFCSFSYCKLPIFHIYSNNH
jgi:hypothetical protein